MNKRLNKLNPYPFENLRSLLNNINNEDTHYNATPINLSIGEPKHPSPAIVKKAIIDNLSGLSVYPSTKGDSALREVICKWLRNRYKIASIDAESQVLPALGSREALFSFTQIAIDSAADTDSIVICPNPFYQIYEGATFLAGAKPYYINLNQEKDFSYDWDSVPDYIWKKTKMVFVCSPGNPVGNVISLDEWKKIFYLSNKYGFIIASDECYSEIYDETMTPPLGGMQAADIIGINDFKNLVVFSSLSKRSSLPGLRSGFIAGDSKLLNKFLLYRTYNGSAMGPVIANASIAAWSDEAHVQENRKMYTNKINTVLPILQQVLDVPRPQASFYLWIRTPISDTIFTRELYKKTAVTVLPGSFLARESLGENPGKNRIRIALVSSLEECVEAANRIINFVKINI
ncbi:acetylornithine/N-succinyldiaminopimelate aminotransferase [Candidatus Kinetoplastibacterium blastocrithidii TCC012E]|uniref:Acetylornithine/N-succinyldiaminopimelate aminotransferase n=1 Tax=Candidatus Kinetoplastidibacterium blastocrithidiae TCC012E TaxID=1208922 RepID=M1LB33_9PROT|nr:succinyldiaminopimelate transaminase [Candidatus Kinetoplastibacterium blastocrithidii]AFZ83554.1 succinyldiaminopimelate transaminase [Candidatus Kinetoplastibacterium blastocrithidii (ex Strigomonas culicis)]AGF49673.1 acetylornithine/N-succinyldiaminopimelate aminotransferase [Candidatus Kinetoplastibacterium blastocrithidii TCC012E]